jgi:hypothetical protein
VQRSAHAPKFPLSAWPCRLSSSFMRRCGGTAMQTRGAWVRQLSLDTRHSVLCRTQHTLGCIHLATVYSTTTTPHHTHPTLPRKPTQAAAAAALMQRFVGPPASSPTATFGHSPSFQQHSASLAPPSFFHSAPGSSAAGTPRGMAPPSPVASPMRASLQQGFAAAFQNPVGGGLRGGMIGSAFLSPTAAAAAAQACAAGGGTGAGTLYTPYLGYGGSSPAVGPFDPASAQGFMSFDSFRSGGSSSGAALAAAQAAAAAVGDVSSLQSGSSFAMQHSVGGLLSPSAAAAAAVAAAGGGFLGPPAQAGGRDAAAFAHDGLDVPGTAQVGGLCGDSMQCAGSEAEAPTTLLRV